MPNAHLVNIEQCGRKITVQEIEEITETVTTFSSLSLKVLTETICEHLAWFTATGNYKKDACLKLLQKLETEGLFRLPTKRPYPRASVYELRPDTAAVAAQKYQEIKCDLQEVGPVTIEPVTDKAKTTLWDQYVECYHYLGYKRPIGCSIKYFAKTANNEIVACALFAGAAKSITARDKWIGWSSNQRLRNLPWVINNTRFLIMPGVKVPCLASHILGQINRRISYDWHKRWGYKPLLMETFIDPEKYKGTCYKASNWHSIGRTTGRGLVRKDKAYTTSPKLIFARPLVKDFRKQLCREYLVGRTEI